MLREQPDVAQLSLSALSRRARMAKSNVYRYFGSREELLLEVLGEQWRGWSEELQRETALVPPQTINDLARVFSATAARRPVLCQLTSALPSVLEHNVSVEAVRRFKETSLLLLDQVAAHCHQKIPVLGVEQYRELLNAIITSIVGLWPLAHPSPVVAEVLVEPRFAPFRHDFAQELERSIVLLGEGLLATSRSF